MVLQTAGASNMSGAFKTMGASETLKTQGASKT
jgi:hypothetical protein